MSRPSKYMLSFRVPNCLLCLKPNPEDRVSYCSKQCYMRSRHGLGLKVVRMRMKEMRPKGNGR